MGDAREPATEWGRYLRRWANQPGWSVARLARESGIARQTIFDWIRDGGESVTIGYVRRIADAVGDDVVTALHAAGNIPTGQVDREVARILDAPLDDEHKQELIEYVRSVRDAQYAARAAEIEALLKTPRRAA